MRENFLSTLNDAQAQAVQHVDGPLLVLAGAGTGKTKVLTTRIANLIMSHQVFPSQILAVTFTNKAAREMQERIGRLVGEYSGGMWLGTFHSIGAKILRKYADLVGLSHNFTIIDAADVQRVIKQLLKEHHIDEKRWPAKQLAWIISNWKNQGLQAKDIDALNQHDFADGRAKELYQAYEQRLRGINAVDFDDLLLLTVTLFKEHADVLEHFQRQFKYILVDEYQDTNVIQYLWLRLLSQKNKNICCVGDDDQSIYGWRGAEVGNILRFEKDFTGANIIRLERNYRSTSHILDAASGLINNNKDRLGKSLWTESNQGDPIDVVPVWDEREEAKFVANEIETYQQKGVNLNEMAVLVRAGFQTRGFEECFIQQRIPYRIIGGMKFYERAEIKDMLAYIRLIAQPADDLALERIINTPKRAIGATSVENIRTQARSTNCSMFAFMEHAIKYGGLPAALTKKITPFVEMIHQLAEQIQHNEPQELIELIFTKTAYYDMLHDDKSVESQGKIENIRELIRAIGEFDTLDEFLEHVSLVTDVDTLNNEELVNVMTLHAAKGLEFDLVFLPGWEEGLFPHQRSIDEKGHQGVEEERRLAYVGITRAKKYAQILYAANRRVFGQYQNNIPSRFLEELPHDNINKRQDSSVAFYSKPANTSPSYASDNNQDDMNQDTTDSGYVGQRVFHQKFGYGYIQKIEGDHLEISFDKAGFKKIISRFVEAV